MNKFLLNLLFLATFCTLLTLEIRAQKTVQFRISTVYSNVDDMDGWANSSDPAWCFEMRDNSFSILQDDNEEFGGTDCIGTRTINRQFFSEVYDCELPNSYRFRWRARENDALTTGDVNATGGDAVTGLQTINIPASLININQSTYTTINTYTATASGDPCGSGGTVTWRLTLQYRVINAGDLCHDECNDPYVLPTAAEFECQGSQTITPVSVHIYAREPSDATEPGHSSDAAIASECGSSIIQGTSPEEIWLRTTIPDSTGGVIIQFENHGECTGFACFTNVSYAWYTSSNGLCSGLEYRGCGAVSCLFGCNDGEIKVDGRANEDVWVRIWEEDDQGFHIEINQIRPTAPADKCYTAMPLSDRGCNYQATSPSSGTYAEPDLSTWTDLAHPDLNPNGCASCICQDGDNNAATNTVWSSNENLVWYTFTQASTGPFDITVQNMSCLGGANTAQLGVFTNSGTAQSPSCDLSTETGMGCSVGVGTVTLNLGTLPAGEYILVVDGNAGAECEWTFQSNTLLALILYDFKAVYDPVFESVEIELELMTDADREGVFLQRSINGIDFVDVEFIPSGYNQAEGEALHYYAISDRQYPYVQTLYYRLKEQTFDDQIEYSNIRAVQLPSSSIRTSVLQDVHPNPAEDQLFIPFYIHSETEVISADIYDIQGRLIMQLVQNQQFSVGKQRLEIEVGNLPRGVYTLRFTAEDAVSIRKFVLH